MNFKIKPIGLLMAISLLAGCASYHAVPYLRRKARKVHAIGLLSVNTPPGLTVSVRAPAAAGFGLIGGLIEEGVIDKKSNEFTKAARSLHYSLNVQLTDTLVSDLRAEGYQVNSVKVPRIPDKFLNYFPKAPGDDALLDVVVHRHEAGYRAAGDHTKYYPYLFVTVRLVSVPAHRILYSRQIVYNPIDPPGFARTIAPDPAYGYQDFDHLMANPKESVEGLEKAVNQVGRAIADDLK